MARMTDNHFIKVNDLRGAHLQRYAVPAIVSARASQVGRGIIFSMSSDILFDRLGWEQVKNIVDKAFRDDEEILLQNPLW